MTIHTDAGFSSGLYTVTRAGIGSWVEGKFVRPTPTTFPVDMAEYPGTETQSEETHGTEGVERRTLYTDTPIFAATPSAEISGQPGVGREADLITIDGELWIVRSVNHYKVLSGHYTVTVERLGVASSGLPEAT